MGSDLRITTLLTFSTDTGCSTSIIKLNSLPDFKNASNKRSKVTNWTTNGGGFVTTSEVPLTFKLPGFTSSKSITYTFQIDKTKSNHKYDVILGRDIQRALGMDILWSKETIIWDNISVPMRSKLTENITKFKDVRTLIFKKVQKSV